MRGITLGKWFREYAPNSDFPVTAEEIAWGEALKAVWQQINGRVHIARYLSMKDMRGYIDLAKWQEIANVAHSNMSNA